jgi:hypothetical protein
MFAETKDDVPIVAARLMNDSLIMDQGIIVRQYMKPKILGHGVNDLPITNEWRFFFLKNQLLAHGYYWNYSFPEYTDKAELTKDCMDLAHKAAKIISDNATFFVIDVMQLEDGSHIVVEINDAQMSGLNAIDPHDLYSSLAKFA